MTLLGQLPKRGGEPVKRRWRLVIRSCSSMQPGAALRNGQTASASRSASTLHNLEFRIASWYANWRQTPREVPTLTLVAGPNGSGKSTLTAAIAFEGLIVVDPDAIARTIDAEQPSRAAIAAARRAVLRCRALVANRESFILESTLAGHGALSLMREAKRVGYRALLIYVSLGDPELHIERVRLRVSQGGHDIPDSDIRRRYGRSLLRAPEAIRLADETVILDNSGLEPERMLMLAGGRIIWRAGSVPQWVQEIVARLE